jgi:hypothetical protein
MRNAELVEFWISSNSKCAWQLSQIFGT